MSGIISLLFFNCWNTGRNARFSFAKRDPMKLKTPTYPLARLSTQLRRSIFSSDCWPT